MRDLEVIDSELSESSCRAEALREVARRRGRRRATAITLSNCRSELRIARLPAHCAEA